MAANYVLRGTIKSVAALMAQADLDEDTPAAWRLLFAEMLRVVQAVHDAHLARSESEQAGRLADEARKALDNVRARLGSLEALRAELPAVVEAAQREAGRGEGGGCEASAPPGGQRWAAARAVRRDDNEAGTGEAVIGSGAVNHAKLLWPARTPRRPPSFVDVGHGSPRLARGEVACQCPVTSRATVAASIDEHGCSHSYILGRCHRRPAQAGFGAVARSTMATTSSAPATPARP